MKTAAGIYSCLTLVAVLFHVSGLLGAPIGTLTMGGRWPGVLPPEGRLTAAASIILLLVMAVSVLGKARLIRPRLPERSVWLVAALQILGVIAHVATPSAAERAIWLPQILVMLTCALVVARA